MSDIEQEATVADASLTDNLLHTDSALTGSHSHTDTDNISHSDDLSEVESNGDAHSAAHLADQLASTTISMQLVAKRLVDKEKELSEMDERLKRDRGDLFIDQMKLEEEKYALRICRMTSHLAYLVMSISLFCRGLVLEGL